MVNRFEAGLDGVTFRSNGSKLLGGLYRAAGHGPRPTAILLHGLPGVEKNLDIAYALRAAGWNCLYFHYRGSWGSEGNFSLAGRHDDLVAATDWLTQQACVDPERLAVIGHSAGGHLALLAGAITSRFKAIVALCPLISPLQAPLSSEMFDEFAQMLHGVTGSELQRQWQGLPPVESRASQLRDHPILMLTGKLDDVFPPSRYPALLEAVPTIERHEFANGDHAFSLCRAEVVQLVRDWLVTHLGS